MSDLPDEILNRYEILSTIGSGGSGTVLKARDRVLKRLVAIKILKGDRSVPISHYANLQREAKTICRLKHPNIIDVYDFIVTQDQRPVMLMEYVSGSSLHQLVKEDGPLNLREAIKIAVEICRAMEYAHGEGILHRDLTPRNVIVDKVTNQEDTEQEPGLRVTLLDFGIAKNQNIQDSTLSSAGYFIGTATVASPEQARGEKIDRRSDIYSLGCTLYFTLTGKYPLEGDSMLETLHKQISEVPPSLSESNPGTAYPVKLEEIVSRSIRKAPAERIQSMREFESELLSVLNELNAELSSLRGADKTNPTLVDNKRSKLPLILAIGAALLFSAGMLALKQVSRDAPQGKLIAQASLTLKRKNDVEWLIVKGRLNEECFDTLRKRRDVTRVQITPETEFSADDLKKLMSFKLVFLDMRDNKIDDNYLEAISGCQTLRSLVLSRCHGISDSGLKHLLKLTQLEVLALDGTGIGDRGVKTVCKLHPKLRLLYLSDTDKITDAALPSLMKLRLIQFLEVGHTEISSSGVRKLFELPELVSMNVAGLNLQDDDIPESLNSSYLFLLLMDNPKLTDRLFARIQQLNPILLDVSACPLITKSAIDRYEQLQHGYTVVMHSGLAPVSADSEHYFDPSLYDLSGYDPTKMKKIIFGSQVWALSN